MHAERERPDGEPLTGRRRKRTAAARPRPGRRGHRHRPLQRPLPAPPDRGSAAGVRSRGPPGIPQVGQAEPHRARAAGQGAHHSRLPILPESEHLPRASDKRCCRRSWPRRIGPAAAPSASGAPAAPAGRKPTRWRCCSARRRRKPSDGYSTTIYGTDIEPECLRAAREGRYPAASLKSVPARWRQRYFTPAGAQYVRGARAPESRAFQAPQYPGPGAVRPHRPRGLPQRPHLHGGCAAGTGAARASTGR